MAHREFGDWLKAYLDYASRISETPLDMLYWAGVSAIAGALQRKAWIDQGRFMLYPNFFIVFVADAGVIQKSTTINSAINLLRGVKDVNFAPDACTWEGFIKYMEECHKADEVVGDDFLNQEQHKTSAITIAASELSMFLDTTNKYMVSALIKLWDCEDTFVKLTKFSGTEHIEKPCLNLIGGTTPSWMRESFDRWGREGGLASRMIFIHGSKKRQLIAFPKRHQTPDHDKIKAKLIADLDAINRIRGEYVLDPHTFEIGEKWYEEHNEKVVKPGYIESSGFKDRKQSHILKLSMIIAASRGEAMRITPDIWAEAVVRIDEAEQGFPKSFASTNERIELRPYYDLRDAIKLEGEIERTKLYSRYTHMYLLREMQQAIVALEESKQISKTNRPDGMYLKWIGGTHD